MLEEPDDHEKIEYDKLRDQFAMAALAGGLEQGIENDFGTDWWHEPSKIAERAYAIADAMMELRNY